MLLEPSAVVGVLVARMQAAAAGPRPPVSSVCNGAAPLPTIAAAASCCCRCSAAASCCTQAWEQPGSGLILNERLINCPPQLAPPLVQALFSEISWATEDEPTQVGGQKGGGQQ